jgi:hypothetical protein
LPLFLRANFANGLCFVWHTLQIDLQPRVRTHTLLPKRRRYGCAYAWICNAGNNNGIPDGGETLGPYLHVSIGRGVSCGALASQDAWDRRRERPSNASMGCKFVIDSDQNACVLYECVATISARAKANPFNWTQAINGYRYLSCCFESHLYLVAGAFY